MDILKIKKIYISILIIFLLFILMLILIYKKQKIAVLGYHSFIESKHKSNYNDPMIMDIHKFEQQLKFLKYNNYKTLTLDEFYCWKQKKCKIPRKSVLITMDDGYASNYYLAFPLLKKYNMNAVVFYVGNYIFNVENSVKNDSKNYMSLNDIENSKKEYPNIEFASHSFDLHYEGAIEKLDYEQLNLDILKFKQQNSSDYFAYPYGHYNDNIIDVLKNNNYKMAFTFGPDKNHRKATYEDDDYKIPRLNISNDMSIIKFILRLIVPF